MRKLKLDELNRLSVEEFKAREKFSVSIVLDNIRSGFNVGSFFRTADAFALEQIILCGFTPQPPHPEIFKTAIGATEGMEWRYEEHIENAILKLKKKKHRCIGIEQTNQSIPLNETSLQQNQSIALVFGNEVNGLTTEILPLLDEVWEIPQFGTKHSLNVSVCGGIVLWDIVRRLMTAE